jgi:ABC-type antimicrobial peptide transport system permease subunit
MALGAERGRIVRMVLRESLTLAVCGLVLAAPGVWAGSKLVTGLIYGMGALDPAALAVSAAVIVGAAAVATYWPARRAAGLEVSRALRWE